MEVLIIVNPNSGLKNSKNKLLDVLNVFSGEGYEISIYVTQKEKDAYEYLLNHNKKFDIVCAFGGDGTLNEVTNALMKRADKPLIGYFPSGTMNDFGSNFKLGNNFLDISKRIIQNNIQEFDVGDFNGTYFNYVAAFGAFCDVPYTTNRNSKAAIGNLAYILEGISKLPQIKPVEVEVEVNNEVLNIKALFGIIFSGGRVAGVKIIDEKESNCNDGLFNIVIVEYEENIFEMPDYLMILANQDKYIHTFKADSIKLTFKEETYWTLDGEKADGGKEVNIKNINKALKILV